MDFRTPDEYYEQKRRETLKKALKDATYMCLSEAEDVFALEDMLDELVVELETIEESLKVTRKAEARRVNGHRTSEQVKNIVSQ